MPEAGLSVLLEAKFDAEAPLNKSSSNWTPLGKVHDVKPKLHIRLCLEEPISTAAELVATTMTVFMPATRFTEMDCAVPDGS